IRADILGDGGNHWLRAELVDSTGALHYVDLAKKVDWTGWRNVEVAVDIAESKLKLRRIYVIALDASKPDLAKSGAIMIDNLKQVAIGSSANINNKVIDLIVDNSTATVNGEKVKLDVAPRVVNQTTFLPFRTVAEQLGAQISYDEKDKSISVFYADKYIKLYVNKKEFIMNGERKQTENAPFISSSRTLVPLRLISESLGFK